MSADPNVDFPVGFSANLLPDESDFTRLTTADLDELLGEKRYSVARDIQGLTRRVATGRLGEEVFPLILAIAIVIFCIEHFVANWFYRERP